MAEQGSAGSHQLEEGAAGAVANAAGTGANAETVEYGPHTAATPHAKEPPGFFGRLFSRQGTSSTVSHTRSPGKPHRKHGSPSPRPQGSPNAHRAGKEEGKETGTDGDDDDDDLESLGPAPQHISMVSRVSSVYTSVIHNIEDRLHRMPKWQFRLMVGSIIFLLLAIVFITTMAYVYGFSLSFPHVQVLEIKLLLPFPYQNAQGGTPVGGTMSFSNPNNFRCTTKPTKIEIYAKEDRSAASLLAITDAPGIDFDAHENTHPMYTEFVIPHIAQVDGGPAIVADVLNNRASYLYTTSITEITVKSLGFLPIRRTYRAHCTILKSWVADGHTLSDCWGRFIKNA